MAISPNVNDNEQAKFKESGNTSGQPGVVVINSDGSNVGTAAATGGATPFKLISAATTNATNVKAAAGQLYHLQVNNINAAVRYLKLYNKASAPTVGTDVPVQTIAVPAAGQVSVNFGIVGLAFPLGISFALTTGVADADVAAVAVNEHVVNLSYK